MAKSRNNIITHGLSGKVGNLLVFRQKDGKTIVANVPRKPTTVTPEQTEHRSRFRLASLYGTTVNSNPALKAVYAERAAQREITVYNCAVADFMVPPTVRSVITTAYNGNIGDRVTIHASDDFSVESFHVRIEQADGAFIEEGNAVEHAFHWEYTATAANPALDGCKIIVTVKDLPENETLKETVL